MSDPARVSTETRGAEAGAAAPPPPASGAKRLFGLVRRVAVKSYRDGVADESARIAYYFFLSFFPLIVSLSAFTSLIGGQAAFEWLMGQFEAALPGLASRTLERFVRDLTSAPEVGVLSVSALLALWSASNIFAALIEGLNTAYAVEQDHGWWKKRALSLLLLVAAGSIALLGGAVALLAGPEIDRLVGFDPLSSWMRWPFVYTLVLGTMWLVYYLLPNHDQRRSKRRILAGAAVGTGMWVAATVLFRLYTANYGRYSLVYGFAGGVVVLLIWLYLTAASLLVGGQVAAVLEQELADQRSASSRS